MVIKIVLSLILLIAGFAFALFSGWLSVIAKIITLTCGGLGLLLVMMVISELLESEDELMDKLVKHDFQNYLNEVSKAETLANFRATTEIPEDRMLH